MVLKIGLDQVLRRSDTYAGMVLVLTGHIKIVHKLAHTQVEWSEWDFWKIYNAVDFFQFF